MTMHVQWILRIGVFGTFLGHGVYALYVRADWIIFLTTVGFSQEMAANLMPVIGIIDIVIALLALIKPMRIVFIYAFIWALATAIMRPVIGMPIWEFVERSANWAVPLSLVFMFGWPKNFKQLFN
ncbi:MAG: hypothetical protein DWQ10_13170 [Calditrichaeota bacterium]|nr:MAG: hypothetical protein DWQ10_13170 [Calditrichota bacterium]